MVKAKTGFGKVSRDKKRDLMVYGSGFQVSKALGCVSLCVWWSIYSWC